MAASHGCKVDVIDFSANMIQQLQQHIVEQGVDEVTPRCGDGQALPYENNQFDVAFSMFGLMFFPERDKGYNEIYCCLKPEGRVVISSWLPAVESPAMQIMFDAVRILKPDLPELKTDLASLENPEVLNAELTDAGFKQVKIERVSHCYPTQSVDEFWQGMVKGSAPVVMLKQAMSNELWQDKEREVLAFLQDKLKEYTNGLTCDAWLGYGKNKDWYKTNLGARSSWFV